MKLLSILFLAVLFSSCVSRSYLESRDVSEGKIHRIKNYGFTENKQYLIINVRGKIENHQLKDYHLKVPMQDLIAMYAHSQEQFVTYTEETKTATPLRKIYMLEHDTIEFTKPFLVMEFSNTIIEKGKYEGALEKQDLQIKNYTTNNSFVYNLDDFDGWNPTILNISNQNTTSENTDYESIILVIEPVIRNKPFPWGLAYTVPADAVLGVFQLAFCALINDDGFCITEDD